jgi:large subunit ribosomal protein L25
MAKEIKLTATKRETSGSSAARALRKKGVLPAVVYGDKGARSIQIERHGFEMMLKHRTSENLILDLEVEGAGALKVLLREVQHGPVFGELLHADFVEVSMTKKMRVTIPVEFVGEPVGVSQEGGILEHVLRMIEVECLPGDLVDAFTLDVSGLALGKSLMVRDVAIDPKFTVLSSVDAAVATVVAPRIEVEVTEEAAAPVEGEAGTEPEVIGKKKEEGEGEGEAPAGPGEKKPDAKKDVKKEEKPDAKKDAKKEEKKKRE